MRSLSLLNVCGVTSCGWLHTTVVDNFCCRLVTFSSDNICTRWERTIASETFLRLCRFAVDWSSVSCRAVLLVSFIIDNISLFNIGFINRFIYIIYSFLIQELIFFILQFLVHLRNNLPEIIGFIWVLIHLVALTLLGVLIVGALPSAIVSSLTEGLCVKSSEVYNNVSYYIDSFYYLVGVD